MSRPKKELTIEGENGMTEILFKVWTISGKPNPAANAFPALYVQQEVQKIFAEGWKLLPGFPTYLGREDVLSEKGAGLTLLFVFGK